MAIAGGISVRGGCPGGIKLAKKDSRSWNVIWCEPSEGYRPTSVTWLADGGRLAFTAGGRLFVYNRFNSHIADVAEGIRVLADPAAAHVLYYLAPDGLRSGVLSAGEDKIEQQKLLLAVKDRDSELLPLLEWAGSKTLLLGSKVPLPVGDSRTRVEISYFHLETGTEERSPIRIWGPQPWLRWVNADFGSFEMLDHILTVSCTAPPGY